MMKRILFILAITLFSCSADEVSTTPQEELNCNCSTILEANKFRLPTGQSFTAGVMENDCTGVQKNFNYNGIYNVGQKICN
jgi:hypothetical protein